MRLQARPVALKVKRVGSHNTPVGERSPAPLRVGERSLRRRSSTREYTSLGSDGGLGRAGMMGLEFGVEEIAGGRQAHGWVRVEQGSEPGSGTYAGSYPYSQALGDSSGLHISGPPCLVVQIQVAPLVLLPFYPGEAIYKLL